MVLFMEGTLKEPKTRICREVVRQLDSMGLAFKVRLQTALNDCTKNLSCLAPQKMVLLSTALRSWPLNAFEISNNNSTIMDAIEASSAHARISTFWTVLGFIGLFVKRPV